MRASTFPTIPPAERLSTKKNRMPPSTAAQVTRSSFPGLRRKKMAVNTITKIGAVNWRTMALAAVVILLAMEKRMLVPHTAKAPSRTQRFILGLWRMAHRYSPMTTRATAVLAPLMDIPFHGITLMQSPRCCTAPRRQRRTGRLSALRTRHRPLFCLSPHFQTARTHFAESPPLFSPPAAQEYTERIGLSEKCPLSRRTEGMKCGTTSGPSCPRGQDLMECWTPAR